MTVLGRIREAEGSPMLSRDRTERICDLLGIDAKTVAAESMTFEPLGDGWVVRYEAFRPLSAQQMSMLALEDERAVAREEARRAHAEALMDQFKRPTTGETP